MNTLNRRELLSLGAGAVLLTGVEAIGVHAETQTASATATAKFKPYEAKAYTFDGLKGLDKDMLDQHYNLYKGYVTNVNKAQTQMTEMLTAGKGDAYEFAETRRRLGFEYAGMRLHEYYFGALKPEGAAVDEKLKTAVAGVWGSWEAWVADITRTALMRGIGWAILYRDTMTGSLQNFWATDHENGHPPGFAPVFVLDVWEHAYIKQFGAAGRKAYVEALLKNVDWAVVAKRLV